MDNKTTQVTQKKKLFHLRRSWERSIEVQSEETLLKINLPQDGGGGGVTGAHRTHPEGQFSWKQQLRVEQRAMFNQKK